MRLQIHPYIFVITGVDGNAGSLGKLIASDVFPLLPIDKVCAVVLLQSQLPSPETHLANTVKHLYLPETAK